ncbi:TetR/AcrR family transcriptional regulator C-terminal domain-containing protein [Kitasatospora aureofaciens]|uniref:TetR/AcrR family transcriptional regulator C-terminal domain-containing protein n=1 Tax=Kitasatospora aureofaciens TaxID=1894 RepID=UPI001C483149|nr:TetR/AcrR family transcriptional regulator C-terminal domain-containing protein [Kitasatospora aureofaciens]MBV6697987.1 TetR/AcrR family transcriptional regulator C-terminal domain-containing protein [Kitasatospora aureofaciens]
MAEGGTPSGRILAELRRRITSGELAPGERVPSTRRITREWGVAMATATKVLTRLREEGLVRAVPGVGTVVAAAGAAASAPAVSGASGASGAASERASGESGVRRARAGERDLTRERIVATAVQVADAEGLTALSMRRVATELGAATMSLYRHVPGKDDLLRLMMDEAFREEPLPDRLPGGWREGLEAVARLQWRIYRRHPWLAATMSFTRPVMAPDVAVHTERSMAALAGLGLEQEEMAQASVTLAAFVCGLAVHFEREAQAEQDSGMSADEWMDLQDGEDHDRLMADPERFPMFDALNRGPEIDMSLDALFEFGVARMLDGIGAVIERRAVSGA